MNLDGWLRQRRPVWKRLETIVDQLLRRGPRRTPTKDLADLVELYQSACADLARLRSIGAEPDLVEPLNRLIIRAWPNLPRRPGQPLELGGFFPPRLSPPVPPDVEIHDRQFPHLAGHRLRRLLDRARLAANSG